LYIIDYQLISNDPANYSEEILMDKEAEAPIHSTTTDNG
jgi:hypothetical protein